MFDVQPEEHLPETAYAPEVSDRVNSRISERTTALLASGCSAVADAVFDAADRRLAIERAADRARTPFVGIWLTASPRTLKHRIETRCNAASDATHLVLEMQLKREVRQLPWIEVSTSASLGTTVEEIRKLLQV